MSGKLTLKVGLSPDPSAFKEAQGSCGVFCPTEVAGRWHLRVLPWQVTQRPLDSETSQTLDCSQRPKDSQSNPSFWTLVPKTGSSSLFGVCSKGPRTLHIKSLVWIFGRRPTKFFLTFPASDQQS